ncbi:unnamed protein product [Gongylonema pulchrum]|uniref:Uncharacterized protein n=1 Tax=Gongylonema pulchrum TaxID=637853 RepID=A0A183DQ15_9BILA|nr:unnamed protein product [Gongylonema pulchrum]
MSSGGDRGVRSIRLQGVLEKLKEREFPWTLTSRKHSVNYCDLSYAFGKTGGQLLPCFHPLFSVYERFQATWVLRFYVLRHADTSDPDAFVLEQHEDDTFYSKVRKTLDLRRVVQVDTNITLKVGSQSWIIAIHYKSKRDKLKVSFGKGGFPSEFLRFLLAMQIPFFLRFRLITIIQTMTVALRYVFLFP